MLLIAIFVPGALALLALEMGSTPAALAIAFVGYPVMMLAFQWRDSLRGNFDLRTWLSTRGYRRL